MAARRRSAGALPSPASSARAGPLVNTPSDGIVSRGTQGNPSGGVPGRVGGCVRSGL